MLTSSAHTIVTIFVEIGPKGLLPNTASINSGGGTARQLTALTVAFEKKHK